jgi:radical SAM-linked protein
VQRLRIRYAKRGRLRFTSHRDFARAFERALRRAGVPMAYSAGFSPHPKVSYVNASATGVASEAEYLEIALAERRAPDVVRRDLDAALPPGLDIVEVVEAEGPGLGERINASLWRIELPEAAPGDATRAIERFLALEAAPVERRTKDGTRVVDARSVVALAGVSESTKNGESRDCAIIHLVVRHATPAVRPDDVLTALRQTVALLTPVTPIVTRLAQGLFDETPPVADAPADDLARLADPLVPYVVAASPQ